MTDAQKYEKDGKVAVLYSPGYGAGWYTWNQEHQNMVFDPEIVQYIVEHAKDKKSVVTMSEKLADALDELAKAKYPDAYTGGIDQLCIAWIDKGELFRIDEYDGNESITFYNPNEFITA